MRVSLGEQLPQVRSVLRRERPEVRPVVQVTSEIAGQEPAEAADFARRVILKWLRDKQRIQGIPNFAWGGEPFEIDASEDRPVSVTAFDNVWAMRYDNPDRDVHGRIWRTEAIVGVQDRAAVVGARLTTITRDWDVPVVRSVPRVILDLAESPGLADYGVPLLAKPWSINTDCDTEDFVALLENQGRTRPVFAVSADPTGQTLVDVTQLAARTAGLAHVASISFKAAWSLSDILGNRLSVFGQAVRTYRPGFDRTDALFEEHPLATRDWMERRFPDPRAFVGLLANLAIDATVASADLEARLPSFGRVREWVAARRLHAARQERAPEAELLSLYEDSNRRLDEDRQAAEALVEEQHLRQRQLEAELEDQRRQVRSLLARVEYLETALQAKGVAEVIQYPEDWDQLDEWTSRHLSDRLRLLQRAARAAKKAEYSDLALACRALQLLAGPYRDMKLGVSSKPAFHQACAELGLEVSPTGEASISRYSDEYVVTYGGQRRELDLHLKKGAAREARNCLRIYFFWDDDAGQVVVGHLPGHLTTAIS